MKMQYRYDNLCASTLVQTSDNFVIFGKFRGNYQELLLIYKGIEHFNMFGEFRGNSTK